MSVVLEKLSVVYSRFLGWILNKSLLVVVVSVVMLVVSALLATGLRNSISITEASSSATVVAYKSDDTDMTTQELVDFESIRYFIRYIQLQSLLPCGSDSGSQAQVYRVFRQAL